MSDKDSVKLHVAENGRIWYLNGEGGPVSTGRTLEQFLEEPTLILGMIVRILGVPRNAALIARLYERRGILSLSRIELAGPQVCDKFAELLDPEATLFRMRQCLLTAAQGGWHVLSDRDYPAYYHSAAWQVQTIYPPRADLARPMSWLGDPQKTIGNGPKHLLHPAMQFIKGMNTLGACHLLAEFLDPRWHVDPDAIERGGRLRTFLGLLPGRAGAAAARARLVRDVWYQTDPPMDITAPGWFLVRASLKSSPLKADQRLAAYLRYNWLDRLFPDNGFFDPEKFFTNPAEVTAYVEHMKQFDAQV